MSSLLLAIFLSTAILICFRIFERFKINILQAIIWNYLVAAILGFTISDKGLNLHELISQYGFPYVFLIGTFFIVVFNLFGHSSQKIGIGVTAVASKMSVVIPILIGVLLYDERLGLLKLLGILLAILAFWFSLGGNNNMPVTVKTKYWFLPILLFLGNGINDSLMKHVETTYLDGSSMLLISCIFTVALFIGTMFSLLYRRKIGLRWELKNLIAGIILGLLNLGSTFFFFECIAEFSNTVFFPVFNVSIVLLSTISGMLLFKEKMVRRKAIGISFAIISIVLIAFST
jgi:drug/metabolite transporter (DMT)-like permease